MRSHKVLAARDAALLQLAGCLRTTVLLPLKPYSEYQAAQTVAPTPASPLRQHLQLSHCFA